MRTILRFVIPAVFTVGILVYVFRISILKGIGHYLIDEDEPQQVEVIFVLGGNSYDRGEKGAELFLEGYANKIVCLGGNIPGFYLSIGIEKTESEMSADYIVNDFNVPQENVVALKQGTSTIEESDIILKYAIDNRFKKVIVVSDKLHTNRIRGVFENKFEENGIEVLLVGTPSSYYDEELWWTTEEGLIMVNNEFVKTLYYWLKY